jgi:TerC family integral membrane protein
MNVPLWVWTLTLVGAVVMMALDLLVIGRRPHAPRLVESTAWVCFYVALAVAFGLVIWAGWGPDYAGQFAAGWVTEYSLSVDNLFVFIIIMSSFAVPRAYQQKILLIGIALALVLRGLFIAAGAALLHEFIWAFYIFGAVLFFTAIRLLRHDNEPAEEFRENAIVRWSRRVLPVSQTTDSARLTARSATGRRLVTPLFIVVIALGTTDVLFALDSIPAIFGLTQEAYLVLTANIFALMGLRQLYFLLGGLLDRLRYLAPGLAVILGFIGVKLVLQALADNNVRFINNGQPVGWAPHIPIWFSLLFILAVLTVTTMASVISTRRDNGRRLRQGSAMQGDPADVSRQNVNN